MKNIPKIQTWMRRNNDSEDRKEMERSERVREIEEQVKGLRGGQSIKVYWTDITQFREVGKVTCEKYFSPAWTRGEFHSFDEERGILVVLNCVVDDRWFDGFGIPIGAIDRIVLEQEYELPSKKINSHPHTSKRIRRIMKRG